MRENSAQAVTRSLREIRKQCARRAVTIPHENQINRKLGRRPPVHSEITQRRIVEEHKACKMYLPELAKG